MTRKQLRKGARKPKRIAAPRAKQHTAGISAKENEMTQTGKLVIIGSESRLDGTPLVIQGDPDPFGAATNSLLGKGLESGDCITVTGTIGKIGKVSVIFMIDATPAPGACA